MIMLIATVVIAAMGFWAMWMIKAITEPSDEGSIMSRCNYSELAAKRAYVRANMDKFGCKDSGTSMDQCKIYTVSPKAMGLEPESEWDKPFNYENCVTNGHQQE